MNISKTMTIGFISTAIMLAACSHVSQEQDKAYEINEVGMTSTMLDVDGEHNASNALDWDGHYAGEIVCDGCANTRMLLVLNSDKTYRLQEQMTDPRDDSELTSEEAGQFTWDAAGSVITLQPSSGARLARSFFIGENTATLVADGKRSEANTLFKLLTLSGNGQQLVILPLDDDKEIDDTVKQAIVEFDAIVNLEFPSEAGYQSVKATYDMDCENKSYNIPTISYYSQLSGMGEAVELAADKNNMLPISTKDDDVIAQAYEYFCVSL